MTCRKCISVLESEDKFCDKCGTATAVFEKSGKVNGFLCLHCGTTLKRTKRYCTACGEMTEQKHRGGLLSLIRRWLHSPKAQVAFALGLFFLLVTPVVYLMNGPGRPSSGKPPGVFSAYTIDTVIRPGEEGSRNQLRLPAGVAMDQEGNLYIADAEQHRILKMNTAGVLFPYAGTGEPGFAGDKGPAYAARFLHPTGLAIDLADYLYVADNGNHRIRRISPDGKITTIAGSGDTGDGNGGYEGDGTIATLARLNNPSAVYTDQEGSVYITDSGNQRLRRLKPLEERAASTAP